jgi:hypothetical protein
MASVNGNEGIHGVTAMLPGRSLLLRLGSQLLIRDQGLSTPPMHVKKESLFRKHQEAHVKISVSFGLALPKITVLDSKKLFRSLKVECACRYKQSLHTTVKTSKLQLYTYGEGALIPASNTPRPNASNSHAYS